MAQVLARRDENWKKVQQYILDEQERVEFRGPVEMLLWGAKREYMWYPRDGFFVRSPVRFNGVDISESEREKYEQNFLQADESPRRARERARARKPKARPTRRPSDLQSLIQQTREPQFVSSAYLLKFKFEGGQIRAGRPRDDRQAARSCASSTTRPGSSPTTRRRGPRRARIRSARSANRAETRTATKCSGS